MIQIHTGEKKIFDIDLVDEDGRPFDLTGYDRFKVAIPTGEGEATVITQTENDNDSVVAIQGNAVLGRLRVTVGSADTAALTAGERFALDIEIDIAATPAPKRVRFLDAVNVYDSLID